MKNKRRNLWMSLTIMCSLLIVFFQFDKDSIKWFWSGHEIAPIILGFSSLFFATLWLFTYKNKA